MSLKSLPLVGMQTIVPYTIVGAITDNDVGKAVKLSATDKVELCDNGDLIYGFINSVEIGTEGGLVVVGVLIKGRVRVTLDGTVAIGAIIEAGAQEAAGSVKAGNWANVSTKTAVAADLAVDASGTLIAASVNALLADALVPKKAWTLISGAGTDGTDGTAEYV